VVEDEEALTTLLRYSLDAEGYEVETVARGDEADTRLKERVQITSVYVKPLKQKYFSLPEF
jgi:DNA-binding response OmpR family regulator